MPTSKTKPILEIGNPSAAILEFPDFFGPNPEAAPFETWRQFVDRKVREGRDYLADGGLCWASVCFQAAAHRINKELVRSAIAGSRRAERKGTRKRGKQTAGGAA